MRKLREVLAYSLLSVGLVWWYLLFSLAIIVLWPAKALFNKLNPGLAVKPGRNHTSSGILEGL